MAIELTSRKVKSVFLAFLIAITIPIPSSVYGARSNSLSSQVSIYSSDSNQIVLFKGDCHRTYGSVVKLVHPVWEDTHQLLRFTFLTFSTHESEYTNTPPGLLLFQLPSIHAP